MTQSPLYIRVHPQDNVAIVVNDGGLARRRHVRRRPRAARARAAGTQGRAGGSRRGRRSHPLQRGDRLRAQEFAEGQLDQRARDPHAEPAGPGGTADRDHQAARNAAARRLHVRGLSQRRRHGRLAQHPRDHHDRAVRRRCRAARGHAHQGRIAAALSERRRCRESRAHLRLRRRDRRARRDGADPHRAQHQPEPEFRRRSDDGEPRLREAAARAPDAAGHDSDRDDGHRRRGRHRRCRRGRRTATSSCCRTRRTSASSR